MSNQNKPSDAGHHSKLIVSVEGNPERCRQRDKGKRTPPPLLSVLLLILLVFSFGMAGGANAVCTDMDLDGYGNPGDISCTKGIKVDCDDTDPLVYPTATKICDGMRSAGVRR